MYGTREENDDLHRRQGVSPSINKALLTFVGRFHNYPCMTDRNFRGKWGKRQEDNAKTLAISSCHIP